MNENDPFLKQMTNALETAPDVQVPGDFAARVMARVPQQKRRHIVMPAIARARYGRFAMLAAMACILIAMVAFAPEGSSSMGILIESALLAQLAALVLWFGRLRDA